MNEATLQKLDRAVLWAVAAISLVPLVPYAVSGLVG